ncbi:glycoside hydrolase family 13 protein [Bifidobacterium gallicum]|uniref:Alpha amylase, catalytic domain protein n=1 Tax=Bifidobacterium gallicum DSM 20093 = LMG 11596 TaxID=561180 RepID=D1NX04_9BIFI|nr:glycoside hydrolase family 13 protein [Bifidobacterium gallicum]EFA22064.1 alpha amylase, catalytic domain protein [Bifidobacterium gallicum DSM 20093 = LMG 11596]KFI59359.1 alpha-amylase [Bifidobacterium gallicum DSM 20093 = LMG 11596]
MTNNNTFADWWKQAVVYQVYPRSFKDMNGDGLGDIAGITDRMPYLHELGVDAIWLSPFYPSELADGGYDVIDYRNVDPRLGTLDDFDAMITAAHKAGIKVVVDIVPNHTSDHHVWFQEALASKPGSPARERYIFRDGQGEHGELPPNGWQSVFGGSAWQQVPDGQWYLHLFTKEQPDLNWKNPEVHQDFKETLRFWSKRGVDGFRIDVAHGLAKDLDSRPLAELGELYSVQNLDSPDGQHPLWDRPEVHDIYREWNEVFNEFNPPRFAVAEAWVTPEHQHLYAREDELGQIFNFEFAKADWFAKDFRTAIVEGLQSAQDSGTTTTWVMSNHDVPRHASRYGLPQVETPQYHRLANDWLLRSGTSYVEDRELGARRSRAALLMELGLPGSVYVYQGEELGLPEVATIPWDRLEDPVAFNTDHGYAEKGRDGCRVPLPWDSSDLPEPALWDETFGEGSTGSFGFSPAGSADPHLPQPLWFKDYCADVEHTDPASMLNLYRRALAIRQSLLTSTRSLDFTWFPTVEFGEQVIAYSRPMHDETGDRFACIVNFGAEPVMLPNGELLLKSSPFDGYALPTDTAVWMRV